MYHATLKEYYGLLCWDSFAVMSNETSSKRGLKELLA
jgi:hypothetical protein